MDTFHRLAVIVLLAGTLFQALPYALRTSPLLPTADDSVLLVVNIDNDNLVSTSIERTGNEFRIQISTMRSITAPWSNVSLNLGKLPLGSYSVAATIRSTYFTGRIDSLSLALQFNVYPSTASPHRLVGAQTIESYPYPPDDRDRAYCYMSGDTLSVVTSFHSIYCPRYFVGFYSSGDSTDDTITLMLKDTSAMICEIPGAFTVIAAIAPVRSPRLSVRILSYYGQTPNPDMGLQFDQSQPALCLNVHNELETGCRIFLDSSWHRYNVVLPRPEAIDLVRLQPNPQCNARTRNYLYLDNIALDTMPPTSGYATFRDTLENFEPSVSNAWRVVQAGDGSSIGMEGVPYNRGTVLSLSYINESNGSVGSCLLRVLDNIRHPPGPCRLSLFASTKIPSSTAAAQGAGRLKAPGEKNGMHCQFDISGIRLTAQRPICPAGAVVIVTDLRGRTLVRQSLTARDDFRRGILLQPGTSRASFPSGPVIVTVLGNLLLRNPMLVIIR